MFKYYFVKLKIIVFMFDDLIVDVFDKIVYSVVYGVIRLEELVLNYGVEW